MDTSLDTPLPSQAKSQCSDCLRLGASSPPQRDAVLVGLHTWGAMKMDSC
jgi:hypothetical protein